MNCSFDTDGKCPNNINKIQKHLHRLNPMPETLVFKPDASVELTFRLFARIGDMMGVFEFIWLIQPSDPLQDQFDLLKQKMRDIQNHDRQEDDGFIPLHGPCMRCGVCTELYEAEEDDETSHFFCSECLSIVIEQWNTEESCG